MYAPANVSWLDAVMREVSLRSELQFGVDVVPLPNGTQYPSPLTVLEDNSTMIDYFVAHQNATQIGLFVHSAYDTLAGFGAKNGIPDNVGYIIYANHTIPELDILALSLQRTLEEVLLAKRTGKDVRLEVSWKTMPRAALRVEGFDVVATNGAQWFYIPSMVVFILLLVEMTTEKEKKLRVGMQMMGLKYSAYWLVYVVMAVLLSALVSIVLMGAGYACMFTFFHNSNFAATFLLFFLFTLACSTLAFFLSTLLRSSATAQTIGYGVILIGFIFQSILGSAYGLLIDMLYYKGAALWVQALRVALFLYPPFNMAQAFADIAGKACSTPDLAAGLLKPGPGFHWADLFVEKELPHLIPNVDITVPMPLQSYVLLAINCVVFLLLALLIDAFFPNDGSTGVRCCWRRGAARAHDADADALADASVRAEVKATAQRMDPEVRDGVYVFDLSKTYTNCCKAGVVAAQDVTLSFERNAVTCILGPNGAGKTTVMSMVLGLIHKTAGDVNFFGSTVERLRHRVGVCPQHDLLFEKLTPREHLRLYARLKQVRGSEIARQVDALLRQVDLLDVADNRVETFSGGMKRRLSVAIACVGDPLILVLDECTTGMDPVHRASVWRIIENVKRNRVVILTTHSMLEADSLSDRVAIMAGGRVQVIGTSIALKNRYGSGWTVSVTGAVTPAVRAQLAAAAPSAALDGDGDGAPLRVVVPRGADDELLALVERLDARAADNVDYVVRQSTLEDVFANVTKAAGFSYEELDVDAADADAAVADAVRAAEQEASTPSPYRANLLKNLTLQTRQRATNVCQVLTPVLLVLTLVLLQHLVTSNLPAGQGSSLSVLLPAFFYPLNVPLQEFLQYLQFVPGGFKFPWFGVHNDADDCVQFFTFTDDGGVVGSLLANGDRVGMLGNIPQRSCSMFNAAPPIDACAGEDGAVSNQVRVPWFRRLDTPAALDACSYAGTEYLNGVPIKKVTDSPAMYQLPDGQVSFERVDWANESQPTLRFSFVVNDHPINIYHRSNNFTRLDIGADSPFASVLKKDQMIVGMAQMATLDMLTRAFAHQLDPTYLPNTPEVSRLSNTKFGGRMPRSDSFNLIQILHSFGVLLYPIALSLQLPIYIYLLVMERADKLRNHMFAHGMRLLPYYATTFLFNFVMSLLAMAALWIAGAAAQIELFSLTSPLLLIVFCVGWALLLVAFAFVLSTMIYSPRAASVIGYVVALFGSLFAVIVAAVMYGHLPFIGNGLPMPWYLNLIPQFAMTRALYLMSDRCDRWKECYSRLPGADDELAGVLAALYVTAALYLLLGLALDGGLARLAQLRVKRHKPRAVAGGAPARVASPDNVDSAAVAAAITAGDDADDDDVEKRRGSRELMHMHRPPAGSTPVLEIDHLSKQYPGAKKLAVDDLSFAISEQQIFALIGPNGAGKTTLLSMLTGELTPTSGDARVCGHSILKNMRGVQQNIGVCTQFDVLWADLTVEETLLFYARLKGVARKHERAHVSRLLRELGLSDARNRKPAQLSGGMRRRLSIGVALSGGSRFVVLDEATTGVDIVSRANIWQIIERAKRHKRSILLTTHAFEEAEKLADLVAIMHKGELRAHGTLAELTETAGSHYILRVAYKREDVAAVQRAVAAIAPHAQVERLFDSVGTWSIAKRDAGGVQWRFGVLFAAMRANPLVQDFSLSDVGLHQVFEHIVLAKDEHHHHQ
jgi:ABC-type multidrug transport system ATPase subunit